MVAAILIAEWLLNTYHMDRWFPGHLTGSTGKQLSYTMK
jgi:hypothetical protein